MFDRTSPLQLVLVEADSLLQRGIQDMLRQFTAWQVVATTDDASQVRSILLTQQQAAGLPDLVIIGLPLLGNASESLSGLGLCRQLKAEFPSLRLLLLSHPTDPGLKEAWGLGVEGYCPRQGGETILMAAIQQVAAGQTSWGELSDDSAGILEQPRLPPGQPQLPQSGFTSTGMLSIERTLAAIEAQLRSAKLSVLDRLILTGRRRELKAARWVAQRLLPGSAHLPPTAVSSSCRPDDESSAGQPSLADQVLDRVAANLTRSSFQNQTPTPLEIDILRVDKKRELFYLILRRFEAMLEEIRFAQVQPLQLPDKRLELLRDLWQSVLTDFLGKYYTLTLKGQEVAVVPALLQEQITVETEILNKIPLVSELFAYLLFQPPLTLDNVVMPPYDLAAIDRATQLLDNLAIHLACAVVQPLLNYFADAEDVKQGFFDRQRLSTREIERFRNDLSWRYRLERYVVEPTDMFSSQYRLFVLCEAGIQQQMIYSPRRQELDRLGGVQLLVTLLLETRDAVAPRLKTATSFLGTGLVYLLTEIIGRGIGLIGRGILKGIGNAFQDKR